MSTALRSTPFSLSAKLTLFFVLALHFFLGADGDSVRTAYPLSGIKGDYYNLLTEGFLRGSTAMNVAVHPGMLSPDPEVRRRSPSLLDANLYHGKYYLYYGVTPTLFFFIPYRLLTEQSLPPSVAVLAAVLVGYFAAAAVWRQARERYFPQCGPLAESLAYLLLGLTVATPFLLTRSSFYEVPIAAGYACAMLGFLSLWLALHAPPRRGYLPLAAASLALGLAVGCRPNYVFTTPILLVVAVLSARRTDMRLHFFAAAVTPAALVGLGLAAYNFTRFGSPLEFGFNYGINSFFDSGDPLVSTRFFWPNLRWTYFTPPGLSPYFPYIFPVAGSFRPAGYHGNELFHGQFPTLLLGVWLLLGLLVTRPVPNRAPINLFIACLAWMGLVSLGFMCFLGIRGNRYVVDFQASFVLLITLAAAWVWRVFPHRHLLAPLWKTGFALLATVSVAANILGSIQQFDEFANRRPHTFRALARALDPTVYAVARAAGLPTPGPVKFTVTFSAKSSPVVEPLLVAGLPEYTDGIYAIQEPDRRIELITDHHGYGGFRAKPFPIEIGRPYVFEIDLGSFYPPRHHSYFDAYDDYSADQIKTLASIRVDGRLVIEEQMRSYDAPPWTLMFGRNNATANPYARLFSGGISAVSFPPANRPVNLAPMSSNDGLWHLLVEFSPSAIGTNQPLLASGFTGAGNLLFAKILSAQELQLGLDLWGYGAPMSPPFLLTGASPHRIEIFVGPLAATYSWPKPPAFGAELNLHRRELQVWIDGKPAWRTAIEHHADSYRRVSIGSNPQRFSSANSTFAGRIEVVPVGIEKKLSFLDRALAPSHAPEP